MHISCQWHQDILAQVPKASVRYGGQEKENISEQMCLLFEAI